MDQKHREMIDLCYEDMAPRINMVYLWPKLLENKVFNRDDVNVPRWTKKLTNNETVRDICLTIKTRGPHAFDRFIASLRQSGHDGLADKLEGKKAAFSRDDATTNGNERLRSSDAAVEKEKLVVDMEREQDNFFHSIQLSKEPLQIQVRKATKFLDGPAYETVLRYPMRSNPRGLVLIITNIHYECALGPRNSAKHDERNLSELFTQMGFRIAPFRDLTGQEILDKVKEFSERQDFRKVDSCFVVVSSHGKIDQVQNEISEIQGVDHNSVLCSDVMDYFSAEACPQLAGKPKVFIFQLCRGAKKQKAVTEPRHTTDSSTTHCASRVEERVNHNTSNKRNTRKYADTIVAHATMPGHVAFRDKITGSWFIQILCEVFMNYACTTHLQDLLNIIDERLEIQRTTDEECQTLMVTSIGFNKHCYLNPGLFDET